MVAFRLGRLRAYLVNTPETTRELLVDRAHDTTKGRLFDALRLVAGNGIATSEGEFHRRRRRLVQPAFRDEMIDRCAATMRDVAEQISSGWQHSQRIALNEQMYAIAAAAASRCLFSTPLGVSAAQEVACCLPILLRGVARYSPTGLLFRLPTQENRRFAEARQRLNGVVDQLIARYREDGVDHGDVLSLLLTARDADGGTGMTDQQVHDEVLTLLAASIETSATTLSWVFHLLNQHLGVEQRLHAELDRVRADRAPVTRPTRPTRRRRPDTPRTVRLPRQPHRLDMVHNGQTRAARRADGPWFQLGRRYRGRLCHRWRRAGADAVEVLARARVRSEFGGGWLSHGLRDVEGNPREQVGKAVPAGLGAEPGAAVSSRRAR